MICRRLSGGCRARALGGPGGAGGAAGGSAAGMIRCILPWPPRALSPNSRHAHWASLARAKRGYRAACAWHAREQVVRRVDCEWLLVSIVFHPPDRRRRDLDNCIAAMKAGLDGLADVLGVDDSRWELVATMGEPRKCGAVAVTVEGECQ